MVITKYITIKDFLPYVYHQYQLDGLKEETLLEKKKKMKIIASLIGEKVVKELTTKEIDSFYNYLFNSNFSLGAIKEINTIINKMFIVALKYQIRDDNPALNTRKIDSPIPHRISYNKEELIKIYEAINSCAYKELLLFLLYTGLRREELLGLCWLDVSIDYSYITIKRTISATIKGRNNFDYLHPTILEEPRTIPLNKEASLILFFLRINMVAKGFTNPYIFTRLDGSYLSITDIRTIKKYIKKKSGIKSFSYLNLRTTFIVSNIANGFNLKLIKDYCDIRQGGNIISYWTLYHSNSDKQINMYQDISYGDNHNQ